MLKESSQQLDIILVKMKKCEENLDFAYRILDEIIRKLPEEQKEEEDSIYYQISDVMRILQRI